MPDTPDPFTIAAQAIIDAAEILSAEALTAIQAAHVAGISRSQWLKMHADGQTPDPIELGSGGRCGRWLRREIVAWLAAGAPSRKQWKLIRSTELRRAG